MASEIKANKLSPATGTALTIGDSGDTVSIAGTVSTTGNSTNTGNLDVTGDLTVDTDTLYVDSTNNKVGIGTSTINNRLVVQSSSAEEGITIRGDGLDTLKIGMVNPGVSNDGIINVPISNALRFATNNTERMRIDSSGNLLVGTTTSRGKITSEAASGFCFDGYITTSAAGQDVFVIRSDVGGTANANLIIEANGDVLNTNNSYGALSDERLKSNIVDASSQIDDIMAVQVRSYTLDSTGDTHIGVVAQELESAGMSGLVKEDEEGMKSVKYSILYMKAIKALQEAVAKIESLEARVAVLEAN